MTTNFRRQIEATVATLDARRLTLQSELDSLESLRATLQRDAERFASPLIEPAVWPDVNWRVWIPPFREEHYDGDTIEPPFGDTYWPTLAEASEFLESVLADIAAGKHGALAPQS